MTVIWTKNAKNDLINYKINSQIITEGKVENYINSLIDYVNSLKDFNKLGKFMFNRNNFKFRQLIYNMHRIFYAINNDKVYILVVYHTVRDMANIIKYLKSQNLNSLMED